MFKSFFVCLCLMFGLSAQAELIKGDFLGAGDGLVVTDSVTKNKFMTFSVTEGKSYNEVNETLFLDSYAGWRFADRTDVIEMMVNTFSNFSNGVQLFVGVNNDLNAFRNGFGELQDAYLYAFIKEEEEINMMGIGNNYVFTNYSNQYGGGSNDYSSDGFSWWLINDEKTNAAVPGSTSLFLLGLGLVGISFQNRKNRKISLI